MAISAAFAQADTSKAGEKEATSLPAFTLLKVDSTSMTRMDLPKNKKIMIMFFSPGCDHCKHQTDSILSNIEKLKDVEILMTTYQPFDEMKVFYQEYKLAKYSNVLMARDIKYFFPSFYKFRSLPFLALFNEKGKLITTFEGSTKMAQVVEAFQPRRMM